MCMPYISIVMIRIHFELRGTVYLNACCVDTVTTAERERKAARKDKEKGESEEKKRETTHLLTRSSIVFCGVVVCDKGVFQYTLQL